MRWGVASREDILTRGEARVVMGTSITSRPSRPPDDEVEPHEPVRLASVWTVSFISVQWVSAAFERRRGQTSFTSGLAAADALRALDARDPRPELQQLVIRWSMPVIQLLPLLLNLLLLRRARLLRRTRLA